MAQKTIVCFGDSNTWGAVPYESVAARHDWETRWPGVLLRGLGESSRIIEEGLSGRTTSWEDPLTPGRNGKVYLPIVLETHAPIDLLIIMLGTNDLKARFNLSAFSIAQSAGNLVEMAVRFESKIPHVLLISPVLVVPSGQPEKDLTFDGAVEKSKELAQHYQYFAQKHACHFLNAALHAKSSAIDGIHLDADAHRDLGQGICRKVSEIFGLRR